VAISAYVKKGHHPFADDGPWCFVSGLTSSADPLWPDDNKGNNSRDDGHDDRQDDKAVGCGRARHGSRLITAGWPDPGQIDSFFEVI